MHRGITVLEQVCKTLATRAKVCQTCSRTNGKLTIMLLNNNCISQRSNPCSSSDINCVDKIALFASTFFDIFRHLTVKFPPNPT